MRKDGIVMNSQLDGMGEVDASYFMKPSQEVLRKPCKSRIRIPCLMVKIHTIYISNSMLMCKC
jgi:hypothetical protein